MDEILCIEAPNLANLYNSALLYCMINYRTACNKEENYVMSLQMYLYMPDELGSQLIILQLHLRVWTNTF